MVTIHVEMPEGIDTSELQHELADLGLVDDPESDNGGHWLVVRGLVDTERQVARALATVHGWAAEHRLGSLRVRVDGLR